MYISPTINHLSPILLEGLFPPPVERLQWISFANPRGLPTLSLGAVLISCLADAVVAGFPEPYVADVLAGDALPTL